MGEAVTMYSGASELAQGMSTELKCSKKINASFETFQRLGITGTR